jgi:hypothetical protein
MVDSCTITRTTVTGTDPDTGQQTTSTATIYTGKCRIQQIGQGGGTARPATVGEALVFQQPFVVQLPVATSAGVDNGDLVTVTAATNDPDLSGRRFWVKELAHKTHATARRLGIEEVAS